MKKVAFVTYSASPKLTADDSPLAGLCAEQGLHIEASPWNKSRINWSQFDAVVLRSCWDYHRSYYAFLDWLTLMNKSHINLWNPVDVVRWNSQKTYLQNLQQKGIRIPQTMWLKKKEHIDIESIMKETGWKDLVIKPIIGANAYGILRINQHPSMATQWKLNRLIHNNDIMVQQFMPEIITKGEYSFIFIGNTYSHAVYKHPTRGDYRTNNNKSIIELTLPSRTLITQASEVLIAANTDTLYARVDCVFQNNKLTLMELELIEPTLFFAHHPKSMDTFVKELKKRTR